MQKIIAHFKQQLDQAGEIVDVLKLSTATSGIDRMSTYSGCSSQAWVIISNLPVLVTSISLFIMEHNVVFKCKKMLEVRN